MTENATGRGDAATPGATQPAELDCSSDPAGPRTAPRKRRRRSKKRRPTVCCREGCDRGRGRDHPACSYLCAVVAQELERAQRLCEALGGDTEHWLAVVALNDALTAYWTSDKRVYLAAREVGLTDEQWRAIKRGDSDLAGRATADTASGACSLPRVN